MNVLRKLFSRWPVTAFYLCALAFSWGYWLTMLPLARPGQAPSVSHLPGLLGPMVAALFVTAVISGRSGLLRLASSALLLPRPYARNVLLALSPLGIGAVTFLALRLWGIEFPAWSAFAQYPGLPKGMSIVAVTGAVLLLNGFGEEIGWRGFATAQLLPRLGKFRSAVVVGALWLPWHAPLFFLNTSMHNLVGPVFFGWAFALLCGAFALGAVYLASGQSVLVVAVWHTLYNMVVATSAGAGTPAAVASTAVMIWGAFVALIWWRQDYGLCDA
jgi:membrane protease YdiL (CAAX protease family)